MKSPQKESIYDPRKCTQKSLEQLIPSIGEKIIFEMQEHHHFINFYKASKPSIPYYETSIKIHPESMKVPYSNFDFLVGKLAKKETFKNDINEQVKVELLESQFGLKYVLKTYWIYFDRSKNNAASIKNAENFATKKYNEYEFAKIFSSCPYSVKAIDFSFVYIIGENIFLSEFLETYGGKPIIKALPPPIFDSKLIYKILVQNAYALNFMEVLKIAHNDIKDANILVDELLGEILIRYIDFDIGENLSPTLKNSKITGPKGMTKIYAAPEILKIFKDENPLIKSGSYSPWKCQVYSLSILMLQLIGFFPYHMNSKDIDYYKVSEFEYNKFLATLDQYVKTIDDSLLRNILVVLQFCLSYNSDKRLSGNELIEIIAELDKRDTNFINNKYQSIIKRREKVNQEDSLSLNYYSLRPQKIEEKVIFNDFESENNKLREENKAIKFEINEYKIQLEDTANNLLNLVNLGFKNNTNNANIKFKSNNTKEIKTLFSNILQEINHLTMKLQQEVNTLNNGKAAMEIQIKDLKEQLTDLENPLKDAFNQLELLRKYEKDNKEINLKFNEIKMKIKNENILKVSNTNSFPELTSVLYEQLKILQKEKHSQNFSFKENFPYENNSLFTGQVSEIGIPHGIGMLVYPNLEVKVICEFVQGEIKHNMGMMIKHKEYFFGIIKEGICQNPTFIVTMFKEDKIESFYLGDTKNNNIRHGKGKFVFTNGSTYDGDWKNDSIEGKGKFVYANGNYYEGDFRNKKKDGLGKQVYSNGGYYIGSWKNDIPEGKGKYVFPSGDYYDGDWINDIKEGKGKYFHADGDYYEGDWKNDKPNGKGKYVHADGDYYEGGFKNNNREGEGKYYTVKNGQVTETVEGVWKNDKREGVFLVINNDNDPYYSVYKDGKKIK